jgi:hypothetical protein
MLSSTLQAEHANGLILGEIKINPDQLMEFAVEPNKLGTLLLKETFIN